MKVIADIVEVVGKWLTYKNRFEGKIDQALVYLKEHEKRLLRLELDAAMSRNDRAVVHQLYDEYKALGGNSYMNELYKEYCKKPSKRKR